MLPITYWISIAIIILTSPYVWASFAPYTAFWFRVTPINLSVACIILLLLPNYKMIPKIYRISIAIIIFMLPYVCLWVWTPHAPAIVHWFLNIPIHIFGACVILLSLTKFSRTRTIIVATIIASIIPVSLSVMFGWLYSIFKILPNVW